MPNPLNMNDQPKPTTAEHWPRKPQTEEERERDKREIEQLLGTPEVGRQDQPKPTGEWTVEDVRNLWRKIHTTDLEDDAFWNGFFKLVADAHNASLAAEREKYEMAAQQHFNAVAELEQLREQLAVEREKHCRDCCCARSWAALGITENTGKSIPEHIQQLRDQLADRHKLCVDFEMKWKAECEKSRVLGNMTDGLRIQLAAAKEALQMLRDFQNGCPLPSYEKGWNEAMAMSDKVLRN